MFENKTWLLEIPRSLLKTYCFTVSHFPSFVVNKNALKPTKLLDFVNRPVWNRPRFSAKAWVTRSSRIICFNADILSLGQVWVVRWAGSNYIWTCKMRLIYPLIFCGILLLFFSQNHALEKRFLSFPILKARFLKPDS